MPAIFKKFILITVLPFFLLANAFGKEAAAQGDVDQLLDILGELPTEGQPPSGDNIQEKLGEPALGSFKKMKKAKIIVLNKITAKSEQVIFDVGQVKFFGNLSIEVHKCMQSTDPYEPNNLMLLTIFDNKIDDDRLSVFHGWMASSNLSISTLEHPVYEVIPGTCLDK